MRPTVGGCLGGVRVEGGCWSVFRAEPGSSEAGVVEKRHVDEGRGSKSADYRRARRYVGVIRRRCGKGTSYPQLVS
jgi:hypothetical protein